MKSVYERAISGTQGLLGTPLSWVYVLENNENGIFEAAVLCPLENARYLALATDQVIVGENHAGHDAYTVYSVPGIIIPNPPNIQGGVHIPSQTVSTNGIFPNWYTQDVHKASEATPDKVSFYTLNWGVQPANEEPPYAGYSGGALGVLGQVWLGERAGDDYKTFYSYADGLKHGSPEFVKGTELSWIYVLENGAFEAAVLCPLGNEVLAFAPDQVIMGSNHNGFDEYAIYPVQGIIIPNTPGQEQ